MPHVAMLLSMVFRFVPRFTRQGKAVWQANRALGVRVKGLRNKLKTQAEVFSITATWALESSVDTADSMRARGYGVTGRTHYHKERFELRDLWMILWMISLFLGVCVALAGGYVSTYYYPYIRIRRNLLVYIMYFALCMTPMIINIVEAIRWHRLRSKI